jgi:predicted MFS family arabinose efflux permease
VVYEEEENRYKLPYFIASGENGVSYFTDICNQEIYRIKDGKASVLYDQTRLAQLTGLDVSGSVLETLQAVNRDGKEYLCVTCNDGVSVIDIQGETGQTFDTLSYRGGFQILLILRFAAFILAGLIAVYYLLVLLRYLIASGVLVRKKFSLILILGVSVSALVVMTNMLRRFQEDYVEEQIDNMCTVTQIAAAIIDTRDLEQVKYPSDYGTAEYQNLQQAMNKLIDVSSIYSENLYCNLVKMTDDRYYALAYLDNSIGAYYPLDESEVQEVQEVYDTGESYINDGKSDATGSYVYVKTPVEDAAGNVMGVVEVGMVSNTLSQKVSSLRNSIMIEILLMIIIAVFVLNEGFAFTEDYREWKRLKQNRSKVFPQSYLRVITFLCFAAYNMPSSFLPVYVEQFYNDSLPFGIGLAGSLPLTVNFAMIGIMSVFCPKLLRKFGFQVTMAAGAVLCMTGDITMAFAGNYWVVAGGLLANGIGCGLVMNGLSIMVASQEGEDQTKGFAIINGEILSGMICGTVIGAAIAERIGKSTMFLFSFGLWVILLAILIVTGKFFSMGKEKKTARKSSLGQLWSVDVMGYLLLVVVPYTIVNGFTSYFLPVFADSYGLGESQTSLLLVMNCLVGIFLSGVLTNICIKYLGRGAILLSTVLSLGAVVIFGYFQNLYMLAFTLFLLGAAKSFGATSREILFCEAKDVQSMGEDRAMGYYNLADNLGESLGVVVFGGIMSVGFLSGMWMLAGVSVVMLGLQEILHHHHIRHRDT